MITAVDSNVLIDILEPDPAFGPSSREALRKCLKEGAVIVCEVVLAEVATAYGDKAPDVLKGLRETGIAFSPIEEEAALNAARCWHEFRADAAADGRRRIAADFLIGGHALVQADRLLTRDKGFFRGCFSSLKLV
jgi:predicted nucleic acid-binding protein